MRKIKLILSSLLLFIIFAQAQAQVPQLKVVMLHNPIVPSLQGGTRIGYGTLTTDQPHQGFRVWLGNNQQPGQPNCYRLQGENRQQHAALICLQGDGWQPAKEGQGIVMKTTDDQAEFDIVTNGDQDVNADHYPLKFYSQLLAD